MSEHLLFIADLHLNEEQPAIYQRFKQFLLEQAQQADALFILGDLFEYYLGDDANDQLAQTVAEDLRKISQKHHTECYFMAGNRDFLLSQDFAKRAELTILDNQSMITVDGQPLLLSHGDELCTDDIAYQKIRQQLRSSQWQQWFLSQSIDERIAFAQQAREQSQQHTKNTQAEIMDVNQAAVLTCFAENDCQLMLHGHTHRPAFHQFEVDNKPHKRMVVGDWHHQTSFIRYKNHHFQLLSY